LSELQFIAIFFQFSVTFGSHQEEGTREYQDQVHRYELQVRSWSLPDPEGQDGLHGAFEEGRHQGRQSHCCHHHREHCLKNIFPKLRLIIMIYIHKQHQNCCVKQYWPV
jgi:hypothetical protein